MDILWDVDIHKEMLYLCQGHFSDGLQFHDYREGFCAEAETLCYAYTFGAAIRLTVQPQDQSHVKPSLFILSPLGPGGCLRRGGPGVCLAAGFRPRDGEMVLNWVNGSIPLNTSGAVRSLKQNTFFFTGFNDGPISSCEMDSVTSTDNHAVDSCDGVNSEVDSCEEVDSESVRFNSHLLLLNAARVVFTKAMAFSSLLTIRALLA
ncbi:uncharacterized protein LOC128454436 [Pleuronectes platessa]|uniref:uncharacterized protein LOC128454436 n=1 Tax=Pleuronectes platessa TaxID=8262 RepID=UPI00232A0BAC|nr:uncharacterized protein LOC128454436 [Pleuronectes platessa]